MIIPYLNSNEEAVIGAFIEDKNGPELDDEDYEEYWSFIFKVVNMVGKAPIEVSEDGYFFC